jgi:hypothetical protein
MSAAGTSRQSRISAVTAVYRGISGPDGEETETDAVDLQATSTH